MFVDRNMIPSIELAITFSLRSILYCKEQGEKKRDSKRKWKCKAEKGLYQTRTLNTIKGACRRLRR